MKQLPHKKMRTAGLCVLLAALMFSAVNFLPAAVGAASTTRQLPIYCVQRDQKMVSLSFDAAWGDARVRYVYQYAFINWNKPQLGREYL